MASLGRAIFNAANRYLDDDETAENLTNDVRDLIKKRIVTLYKGHDALSLDDVLKGLGLGPVGK